MKNNRALSKLRAGKVAVGTFLGIASSDLAEHVSAQGLDFVILDWQHGEWTDQNVSEALGRLIDQDTAPLVRVRSHDTGLINWVLDMGALGVVVPMVEDADQAKAIVQTAYYPPRGVRSVGGNRVTRMADGDFAEYVAAVNDQILFVAMVETKSAIANVDEIMNTDGIGAVLIGPSDLMLDVKSQGLGEKDHAALVAEVSSAGARNDGVAGMVCPDSGAATERVAEGFRLLVVGSDRSLVAQGTQQTIEAFSEYR